MILDLWERLSLIFAVDFGIEPSIEIDDLSPAAAAGLLAYVIESLRGPDIAFSDLDAASTVDIASPQEAVERLVRYEVLGLLWGQLLVERHALPPMRFFVDGPDCITLEYLMGPEWTPVSLIALFELFRLIKDLDSTASISLNKDVFDPHWQEVFRKTLQEYLDETG